MNYTEINLAKDKRHTYNKTAGAEGESYVNGIKFIIPDEYIEWSFFVDIENACGEKYRCETIRNNESVIYEFTAIDLKQKGTLKLDLVLVNGEKIAKPFIGEFSVKKAICAENPNTDNIPIILTSEIVKSFEECLEEYHHENRTVLDKLSEDENGTLLYDGNNIESNLNIEEFEKYKEQIEQNTELSHEHLNLGTLASINHTDLSKLKQIDIVNKHGFYVNDLRLARANEIPTAMDANRVMNSLNGSNFTMGGLAYFTEGCYVFLLNYLRNEVAKKEDLQALTAPLKVEIADTLPEEGLENTIYLIPKYGDEQDIYEEYLFINGNPELIGSTQIDLANYYTKKEIDDKGYITDIPNYDASEILYSNDKLGLGEDGDARSALDIIVDDVTNFFADEYPELERKVDTIDEQIDAALEEAKESGEFKGDNGLSAYQIWLNSGNEGSESDFLKSLKGEDGEDGASVTHEWNGTVLTIISANGTTSADLKGETGNSGVYVGSGEMPEGYSVQIDPAGDIIHIPSIDEIVTAVLAQLPKAEEDEF